MNARINLRRPGLLDAEPTGLRTTAPTPILRPQRTEPHLASALPQLLGGLWHGPQGARAPAGLAAVPMPLLAGPARADLWLGGNRPAAGRHARFAWQADGDHLFGQIDLIESPGLPLASLVEQGYRELFEALAATGYPHPLRLWNYLPHINTEQQGLERYRHFNQGRQQAFLSARQQAYEGAPAACALGSFEGPIGIRVLAGRRPPLALENPRQVSAYHYPSQYGPRSPSFSRAVLAEAGEGERLLLISGTASIVGHETRHAGDLDAQIDETLTNLHTLVEVARQRSGADFRLEDLAATVHLRRPEHLVQARERLLQALGPQARLPRDACFLHADICRHDLLVEIEAHGLARPAGQRPSPEAA